MTGRRLFEVTDGSNFLKMDSMQKKVTSNYPSDGICVGKVPLGNTKLFLISFREFNAKYEGNERVQTFEIWSNTWITHLDGKKEMGTKQLLWNHKCFDEAP